MPSNCGTLSLSGDMIQVTAPLNEVNYCDIIIMIFDYVVIILTLILFLAGGRKETTITY